MLSQAFKRSTAIRRNSFGYRPTRLFATCSAFPCKVCLIRVSQVKGSVHMWGEPPHLLPSPCYSSLSPLLSSINLSKISAHIDNRHLRQARCQLSSDDRASL